MLVKICFEKEVRRVTLADPVFENLAQAANKLFNEIQDKKTFITWKDNEGDDITIDSQAEFLCALSDMGAESNGSKMPRFIVRVAEMPSTDFSEENTPNKSFVDEPTANSSDDEPTANSESSSDDSSDGSWCMLQPSSPSPPPAQWPAISTVLLPNTEQEEGAPLPPPHFSSSPVLEIEALAPLAATNTEEVVVTAEENNKASRDASPAGPQEESDVIDPGRAVAGTNSAADDDDDSGGDEPWMKKYLQMMRDRQQSRVQRLEENRSSLFPKLTGGGSGGSGMDSVRLSKPHLLAQQGRLAAEASEIGAQDFLRKLQENDNLNNATAARAVRFAPLASPSYSCDTVCNQWQLKRVGTTAEEFWREELNELAQWGFTNSAAAIIPLLETYVIAPARVFKKKNDKFECDDGDYLRHRFRKEIPVHQYVKNEKDSNGGAMPLDMDGLTKVMEALMMHEHSYM